MQPDETPPQPASPNPQYDFILKDQPKSKRSFKIPSFGLPPKAAMIIGAALVLFLVIILASVLFGGKSSPGGLTAVLGQAQEINRVSKLVQPLAQSPDTQGLVATTQAAFTSQQSQLSAYLKKSSVKVDAKKLTIYTDATVDAQMKLAAQNNSLDTTYAAYLKKNLTEYQTSLQAAAKGGSKTRLQILNAAFLSTKTLLAAPQVASATGN